MALFERIRKAKENVKRKTKATKAKKRARARRIEREEPETLREGVTLATREAKELSEASSEFLGERTGGAGSRVKSAARQFDGDTLAKQASSLGAGAERVTQATKQGTLDDQLGVSTGTRSRRSSSGNMDDDMKPGSLDMELDDLDNVNPFE
jgi:hypothetical protein